MRFRRGQEMFLSVMPSFGAQVACFTTLHAASNFERDYKPAAGPTIMNIKAFANLIRLSMFALERLGRVLWSALYVWAEPLVLHTKEISAFVGCAFPCT